MAKITWRMVVLGMVRTWSRGQNFTSTDLYKYETELRRMFPRNATIPDTLRRVMQDLRDDGIVRFVDDRGTYARTR